MTRAQENLPSMTDVATRPRLCVIGVGGGGGNAIDNMLRSQQLEYVKFVVCNTDAQALEKSLCPTRIQLGAQSTRGLGAGSDPEVGRQAAQESLEEILEAVDNAHMVFVVACMGGGTGTGAAPFITRALKEKGILTLAIVTTPFAFEGYNREQLARAGIDEIRKSAHTFLVIPNQNLFRLATEETTFSDAFAMADSVLFYAVQMISDLMTKAGLINLDYADLSKIMTSYPGKALMGTGEAADPVEAAEKAIFCPLLDGTDISSAKALIINITGGTKLKLHDVDAAVCRVKKEVLESNVLIIMGAILDPSISDDEMRVAVVAVGLEENAQEDKLQKHLGKNLTVNGVDSPSGKPDVNKSEFDFELEEIVGPLDNVPLSNKPLGTRHGIDYTANQSFDLEDFVLREPESPFTMGPSTNDTATSETLSSPPFPEETPSNNSSSRYGLSFLDRWTKRALLKKPSAAQAPVEETKGAEEPAATTVTPTEETPSLESFKVDERYIPSFLKKK